MVAEGEDELTCDLAETYHVTAWRELPLKTAAVLACGLPEHSRIVRLLSGRSVSIDTELRAGILDHLKVLVWMRTEDGRRGRNRPKSTLDALNRKPQRTKLVGFDTAEAFEKERQRLRGE